MHVPVYPAYEILPCAIPPPGHPKWEYQHVARNHYNIVLLSRTGDTWVLGVGSRLDVNAYVAHARALRVGRVHRGHVLRGRPQPGDLDGRVAGPAVVAGLRSVRLVARLGPHRARDVLRKSASVSGLAVHREPGARHVHRQTVPGRIWPPCGTKQ